ncbi:hypothetical protein PENTCL1PPCAC_5563, partial [Pristionchus entomophagus]
MAAQSQLSDDLLEDIVSSSDSNRFEDAVDLTRQIRWQSVRERDKSREGTNNNPLRRTGTLPAMRKDSPDDEMEANRSSPITEPLFNPASPHYLCVPRGHISGRFETLLYRTSPSVMSMGSEPESCLDDIPYLAGADDDEDMDF